MIDTLHVRHYILHISLALLSLMLPAKLEAFFADVDVTHPYFYAITNLQNEEIVEGHEVEGLRKFFPLSEINRAEALKLILLSAELSTETLTGGIFPDVKENDWFADYVYAAHEVGIVEGFPDGNFYPAAQVRRAEFVKMLLETLKAPVADLNGNEPWYEPYLSLATKHRLLPAGAEADGIVTRGEAAEIIYRTRQVQKNNFTQKYVFSGAGLASYYNEGFAGRPTASGEIYDPQDLTAAHRTLPFGTRLAVRNQAGDFVVVRINDRGPYHKQRVLDLSQAAFERLAPIGTGVLPVAFKIFSEPAEAEKPIPETIRPLLSEETKAPRVPTAVQERLRSPETGVEPKAIPDASVRLNQPIFDETISSIATDFFPNITLRSALAQKVPQGLVYELKGRVLGAERYKEVTVFMQNQADGKQTQFSAPVSGKNFVVTLPFFQQGLFDLGIVFDDQRQSRVAEIEVAPYPIERKFPAADISFASDLNVNVVPEASEAMFTWASGEKRLTKLVFSQGAQKINVVLENGLSHLTIPYAWFNQHFSAQKNLAIDLYQANSADGSFAGQQTNWKKVTFANYRLIEGFRDAETPSVTLFDFQRFYREVKDLTLNGRVLASEVNLHESAFVTEPDGMVNTMALWRNGEDFSFRLEPETTGRYVVEIISEAGEILFNRAIYFETDLVLPVLPSTQTVVTQNSHSAVYDWINRVRVKQNLNELLANNDLREVAQAYAQRMADENFIGHVAPDGSDPASRLEGLNLRSFAENVSYGSNLNLALSGLENSGSHRKNILSNRWSRMGVGLAQNQKGEFYVVQIFSS